MVKRSEIEYRRSLLRKTRARTITSTPPDRASSKPFLCEGHRNVGTVAARGIERTGRYLVTEKKLQSFEICRNRRLCPLSGVWFGTSGRRTSLCVQSVCCGVATQKWQSDWSSWNRSSMLHKLCVSMDLSTHRRSERANSCDVLAPKKLRKRTESVKFRKKFCTTVRNRG